MPWSNGTSARGRPSGPVEAAETASVAVRAARVGEGGGGAAGACRARRRGRPRPRPERRVERTRPPAGSGPTPRPSSGEGPWTGGRGGAGARFGMSHRPTPLEPPDVETPARADPAAGREVGVRPVPHDRLGLVSSDAITVRARVGRGAPVLLRPPLGGLYRPPDFRPAPWTGLAYDLAPDDGTGLAAGSRVLTARGEVPVEHLLPTDEVLGLRGPRLVRPARIARRVAPGVGEDAPVRIEAGAFGDGRPRRPSRLAPGQFVFLPDPVPARALVGGATVRRDDAGPDDAGWAEYFHVALAPYPGAGDGDVLLVDGVAVAAGALP